LSKKFSATIETNAATSEGAVLQQSEDGIRRTIVLIIRSDVKGNFRIGQLALIQVKAEGIRGISCAAGGA